MSMNITVKLVEESQGMTKANKPYNIVEVTYKSSQGEMKGYKMFEFNNKEMFSKLKTLSSGKEYTVETFKNEKGYLDWTAITLTSEATKSAPAAASGNSHSSGGGVDTQKMIVRQNCIGNAINFLSHTQKDGFDKSDVLEIATAFEHHVYGIAPVTIKSAKMTPENQFADLEEDEFADIPD